ncbi:hypothetical protein Bca52824_093394 [Brassica carinata]|uniref:Uncharacterized protein n=1 Tax=Brassica carinata TaxID=52824 RepID=A0A8X7P604_BRACI|nr:hypothetical protein Bca52824_093394 [Brassica carinata]
MILHLLLLLSTTPPPPPPSPARKIKNIIGIFPVPLASSPLADRYLDLIKEAKCLDDIFLGSVVDSRRTFSEVEKKKRRDIVEESFGELVTELDSVSPTNPTTSTNNHSNGTEFCSSTTTTTAATTNSSVGPRSQFSEAVSDSSGGIMSYSVKFTEVGSMPRLLLLLKSVPE